MSKSRLYGHVTQSSHIVTSRYKTASWFASKSAPSFLCVAFFFLPWHLKARREMRRSESIRRVCCDHFCEPRCFCWHLWRRPWERHRRLIASLGGKRTGCHFLSVCGWTGELDLQTCVSESVVINEMWRDRFKHSLWAVVLIAWSFYSHVCLLLPAAGYNCLLCC